MKREAEAATFDLFPENEKTVAAFLCMATQWRIAVGLAGMQYLGLEYASIPSVFDAMGFEASERPAIFHGLRTMEHAALPLLNKARDDA